MLHLEGGWKGLGPWSHEDVRRMCITNRFRGLEGYLSFTSQDEYGWGWCSAVYRDFSWGGNDRRCQYFLTAADLPQTRSIEVRGETIPRPSVAYIVYADLRKIINRRRLLYLSLFYVWRYLKSWK